MPRTLVTLFALCSAIVVMVFALNFYAATTNFITSMASGDIATVAAVGIGDTTEQQVDPDDAAAYKTELTNSLLDEAMSGLEALVK